jgi:hypothetical protein
MTSFLKALFVKLSMKTTIKRYIALCAVSLFIQKSSAQHQISIQTGAFNYFFDNVPLQTDNDQLSLGLQYQYQQASSRLITAQVNIFGNYREWSTATPDLNVIDSRTIGELNVTFSRQRKLAKNFGWNYGLGPTLRNQYFIIDTFNVNANPLNLNFYQSHHLQLGLRGQTSLSYTPFKWLTLYTQLNFSSFLLSKKIYNNTNNDFIQDFGLNQRFNFPSRFHSSLTFGVGINF